MKKLCLLIGAIIILVFFFSLIASYFIFTNKGSSFIVQKALTKYTQSKNISIEKSEGSLARTLVLHGIEMNDPKVLRGDNVIRIQRLEIAFRSFSVGGLNVKIHNGRLQLSASEVIVFRGSLQNALLDGNVYSKSFIIERLVSFFPENKNFGNISGAVSDIDVYVKGSMSEPTFNGQCQIEKLVRNGFSLSNCPVLFNLQLKESNKEPKLNGTISLASGTISGAKTARINLNESRILLLGDPKKASFNLRGASNVEDTKITILLKGTFDNPELRLFSNPPLPQERLLIMLITGKSWKATQTALDKGQFSPDLVRDFLDYFVFSGSKNSIFQRLGISDISVTFDQQKKGVGVKKTLTEKVDASYAVEQSQVKEQAPATTQKVGGAYKIIEGVSIEAEKELKPASNPEVSQEEQKANDKVMIKFKKTF